MNRTQYFNVIEEKLNLLAQRIERRGGLNILDFNIHAENFYLHFLNLLFDWNLTNLNAIQQNAAGIDLVDSTNNIIIQVSATATKQKIESALNKKHMSNYSGYVFKFISISKNSENLRSMSFANPHNLTFSPTSDILDISLILKIIVSMDIDRQKQVYDFIRKELKSEPDPEKVESNLTIIIKILSKENWSDNVLSFEIIPYDPETKISYNQLDTAKHLIDDYKIHYNRIDKIYSDFDKQGINKSISILNGIRSEYLRLMLRTTVSNDQIFLSVIDKVIQKIQQSANYTPMPDEELELCVQILVVDAFIRCKIFKNPSGNTNANS